MGILKFAAVAHFCIAVQKSFLQCTKGIFSRGCFGVKPMFHVKRKKHEICFIHTDENILGGGPLRVRAHQSNFPPLFLEGCATLFLSIPTLNAPVEVSARTCVVTMLSVCSSISSCGFGRKSGRVWDVWGKQSKGMSLRGKQ
ncbi:hypothetical protein CEXT_2721 [Caerostris extrusa]|uniref:Secreted protein n=1 Tax=Caerostris extrusa TaxID=172846 RepID=A0AAV4NY46_CAEEX|nr:hypothetical protein CEXT_2721 [Caerostris extrusa]